MEENSEMVGNSAMEGNSEMKGCYILSRQSLKIKNINFLKFSFRSVEYFQNYVVIFVKKKLSL